MTLTAYPAYPQTAAVRRLNKVMGRSKVRKRLTHALVFSCRGTVGTNLWSAHAFGAATDLMLRWASRTNAEYVGRNVIAQCTKRTIANRGRPVKRIDFVIYGKTQWKRGQGLSFYPGVPHDNHIHAAEYGSTPRRPPCAG